MGKFNFKVLLLLSCGHMVVDIYQGAVPAVLPFLKQNLGLSYTVAGTILIISNVASSVIQPLFGFLSDKKEKAYLLPLGALLAGTAFACLPLVSSYLPIVLLVALSGVGVASYHPEGFKTARFFTGERMATGMSIFSVGGNTGMALGPILALSIVNYLGFSSLPWMVLPALAFTALIVLLRKTIAVEPQLKVGESGEARRTPKGAVLSMCVLISVIIMRTWIQMGLMTYIPFYFINHLQGSPVIAGKLVSLFLLGGAFGTLAGAPLADRWGHAFWLKSSMLVSALIFPLIFYTRDFALSVVVTVLGVVLITTFSVTVVMGQNLLPRNLGVASGLIVGFAIGAGGIGVTLLGVLADHFGVPFALKSIGALPVAGFLLSILLEHLLRKGAET